MEPSDLHHHYDLHHHHHHHQANVHTNVSAAADRQANVQNHQEQQANVPAVIRNNIDFEVGDDDGTGAAMDHGHRHVVLYLDHYPGKEVRQKWLRRMEHHVLRGQAQQSGIPAGLSKKSRKRMRKGLAKDAQLALALESQSHEERVIQSRASSNSVASPAAAIAQALYQSMRAECLHHLASHSTSVSSGAVLITANQRQASRSDPTLVGHQGGMCIVLPAPRALDMALRRHMEVAMMMVWVANSPPASTQVRGHSFGSCGLGVHWWNEARRATASTDRQENIRLYHAWRFAVARRVWDKWVPILPQVWTEVTRWPQAQPVINQITSDCEAITAGGQVHRLHDEVPFTSGYMADAGDRGTKAHFDQVTVGDSWVMIFSCMDKEATGGEFWVIDPVNEDQVVVSSSTGISVVLCKAGCFKHGASPTINGARVVTVLWNSPKIMLDRISDPRPLVFESTSTAWEPGAQIASFNESPIREGLPPKALNKEAVLSWVSKASK